LTGADDDEALQSDLDNLQRNLLNRIQQINSSFSSISPELKENLWMGSQEASSLSSILVPTAMKTKKQLEEIALEIEILKIILTEKKEPSICAELLGERWAEFLKTPLKLQEI